MWKQNFILFLDKALSAIIINFNLDFLSSF